MSAFGMVPSEHSSGRTSRQGGITKASNGAARRMLIEAAWSYRFPARIRREQLLRQERLAKRIRDTAWKAQKRLCRRYRARPGWKAANSNHRHDCTRACGYLGNRQTGMPPALLRVRLESQAKRANLLVSSITQAA
jgi:hypothetical protein